MRAVPFSGYQVVSRQAGLLAKCSILELIIFSISGDSKKNLPGGAGEGVFDFVMITTQNYHFFNVSP